MDIRLHKQATTTPLPTASHVQVSASPAAKPLEAEQRFLPVRSSATRIFSCFLEYSDSHLTVNDILYEWSGTDWKLSISSYNKVRISPEWVTDTLRERGFAARWEPTDSGMVRVVANRV